MHPAATRTCVEVAPAVPRAERLRPRRRRGWSAVALAPGAAIPEEAIWLDLLEPTPEEERQVEQTRLASTCRRARRCARSRPPTASTKRTARSTDDHDRHQGRTPTCPRPPRSPSSSRACDSSPTATRILLPFKRFIDFRRDPSGLLRLRGAAAGRAAGGDRQPHRGRARAGRRRHRHDVAARLSAAAGQRARQPRFPVRAAAASGKSGELISKARESLVSLTRLLGFLQQSANGQRHAGGALEPPHGFARRRWP